MNEYQRAVEILKDYVEFEGIELFSQDILISELDAFKGIFSPEKLEELDDTNLLSTMFYSLGDNKNTLCYWLEMNSDCRENFGSIAGGSAYKFGLFQSQKSGTWSTGYSQKPVELTVENALNLGKEIRNVLVIGANIIRNAKLETVKDYEDLDDRLKTEIGENIMN